MAAGRGQRAAAGAVGRGQSLRRQNAGYRVQRVEVGRRRTEGRLQRGEVQGQQRAIKFQYIRRRECRGHRHDRVKSNHLLISFA